MKDSLNQWHKFATYFLDMVCKLFYITMLLAKHWRLNGWCDQTWIAWQYVTLHSLMRFNLLFACYITWKSQKLMFNLKIPFLGINPYTMSYHVILANTLCSFVSTAIIPVCVCKAYMSFMLTLARVTWKEWKGQNKPTYKRSGLNIFCNIWISLQKTNDINIW